MGSRGQREAAAGSGGKWEGSAVSKSRAVGSKGQLEAVAGSSGQVVGSEGQRQVALAKRQATEVSRRQWRPG